MADYVNKILVYDAGKNRKIGAADNLEIGGNFTAATFYGAATGLTSIPSAQLTGALPALDGSALTDLNGSSINSGTVGASYLPATIAYTDAGELIFVGDLSANSFSGNGSGLTSLTSAELIGALPAIDGSALTSISAAAVSGAGALSDDVLSANVAKYNDAAPTFTHTVSAASFSGSGSQLTSLNASNISSGTVGDSYLSANVAKYTDPTPIFTHTVSAAGFSGDGSALTSLNASNISSGELSDSLLSDNVPLLNAGSNAFTGSISATSFSGAGGSLTGLNAGNITTGTLSDDVLSPNVAKYTDASPTFTNTVAAAGFSGDGSALTSLNASNLSSGTVPDAQLASNILRKDAASNTLTGNLTVNGNLNVGGDIVSGGSVNVVLQDQFLDLNGNNLLGTESAGGIAVNVLSTGTTFDVESFTAGGTGTDPSIVVTGDASALVDGDLIQVSQSASSNDGQYIVYSASYNGGTGKTTVTLYGNAASAHPASTYPQLPFVHNQLTTATETAKLTAITVGVMAVSGGALYAAGPAQIPAGTWCYAYGNDVAAFENSWISLAPAAAQTLQGAYDASSSPATITLATGKNLVVAAPGSGTAAISLGANAASDITVTGATLDISADRIDLAGGNVAFEKAGVIAGVTTGAVAEGTVCYVNVNGEAEASDQASGTDAALEVDGVVQTDTDHLATVAGTKVRVLYTGSAPVMGDVVYLSGGANAGHCQVAIPTSGRVTKLGKCVVNGSAGLCTIIWAPDYIADL